MTVDFMPITRHIHQEFERTMSVTINASDLRWEAGHWPRHFWVTGWERAFNYWSDIRSKGQFGMADGTLLAKVYRDSMGYEIIVDSN